MYKWRYKTVVIRELALSESKLNAEGEKGWELVSVCMSDATTARAFLKQSYEGEWIDQHADTEHALVGHP